MRTPVVLAIVTALVALAGCEDVPATNPFDPATPVSQQAQARLEGTVTPPEGFGASMLARGRVDLVDGAGEITRTTDLAEGGYLFDAVDAGAYLVRVVVPGLVVAERSVQLFRGERTRLPPITLERPDAESPDAHFVVGVARLDGKGDDAHQGIYVEVQDTPYTALTGRDGRFRLQAPPGEITLAFSFPGYGLQTISLVVAADTSELALPEPVILAGQPGRIVGRVRLQPGFADPAQLMAADVALYPADREGEGEPLQRANPGADGGFVFPDVPPGLYAVRVAAAGFFDEVRRAEVAPGGTDDVALITLFSSLEQAPGSITGVARLQGRADDAHGGVLVKAVNQPYLTETEPDGRFTLRVPEGAYTLRLSRPGYGPVVTERLIVGPGADVPLADPVILVALPGRVQGGVVLPFGEADSLPQVEITLADADPETVDATTHPRREDGTFVFADVAPGDYTLRITRDRFVPYERPVAVTPEGTIDVGTVELQPVPQTATITGVAQRQGRQGHGGIRVDLVGAPNTTTTNAEGRFELVVPVSAEGYDLVFTADGYNSARLEGLAGLAPEAMFALDEVVVLTAQPGRVHGFVELQPTADGGFDPSWVEDVVVTLIEAELEVPDGAPAPERTVSPDGEGRFVFDSVAPGSYGVTFARAGFRERFSAATVGVGQSVFIGRVSLVPELGSPDAQPSYIQGVARLACDGECDHGGIRVESSAGGFAALTTRTGAYRLQVVESDYTLRFSREGYRSVVPAEVIRVAEGETAPGPSNVVLTVDPGSVSGVVLGLPPQGPPTALAGAQVAVYEITPEGEILRGEVTTVDDGAFVLGGLRGGAYSLRITAPGRALHAEQVAIAPGVNTALGNRTLDLVRGGLTGDFPRADAALTGGVTVLVRGAAGEAALQAFTWVAVTDPANDRYRLDGLPAGRYEVTAAAPGYRTEVLAEPVEVVGDALAQASGTLARRRNGLDAPPVTRNPLVVTLTADEDNTFGRVWHGGQDAPDFSPLPADGAVQLMLPRDGTHRIFAEVANAAFTDDDPDNDLLAAVSPTLTATVLLDETPPDLTAVTDRPAVGAEPGWVALPDPAQVEVYAADPAPASGLAFVRVTAPGMAPILLPYAARVQVPLPDAGAWPLTVAVIDGAGNTVTAPQPLVMHADAAAPEDATLALAGPARVPSLSGRVRVSATDPDGAPLWFRVRDAEAPAGPFLPLAGGAVSVDVALHGGEDGERAVVGEVRDAAGRTVALNQITFQVDREAPPPSGLVIRDGQTVVPAGGLTNARTVDIEVQAQGAGEPTTARLVGRPDISCPIDLGLAPPRCTLAGVDLAAQTGIVGLAVELVDAVGNRSVPFEARFTIDRAPPEIAGVNHIAAPGADVGYVARNTAAVLEVLAFDAAPGTGLVRIELERDGAPQPPLPYAPRIERVLDVAGEHTFRFRVVDGAGNRSAPATLVLRVDGAAPVVQPLEAFGGQTRTATTTVTVLVDAADPDGSPLSYRVADESTPLGAFLPLEGTPHRHLVALREGADGDRTVRGEVRDAAGHVEPLPAVTFRLDRQAQAPTAVDVLDDQGQPLAPGAIVRLPGENNLRLVDVRVQVDGAAEPLIAVHAASGERCTVDLDAGPPACTLRDIAIPAREDSVQTALIGVHLLDTAGNESSTVTAVVVNDLEGPGRITASLQEGAIVNDVDVVLEIDADGATQYALGGDITPVQRTPADFPLQLPLTLLGADGDKQIHITLSDDAGNTSTATVPVRLDRAPPTFDVALLQDDAVLQGDPPRINEPLLTVRVTPTPGDPDCLDPRGCRLESRVALSPNFEGVPFRTYDQDTPLQLPPVSGLRRIYVQMRDAAGNASDPQAVGVQLEVEVDQLGPGVPGLRRHYISPRKIRLEITPPADADLAYYVVERSLPDAQNAAWTPVRLHPAVADDETEEALLACPVQDTTCGADTADCLRYAVEPGAVVLVEDRTVVPGIGHLYRVRAVDDLGNSSAFSVPLAAGTPMNPPTFSYLHAGEDRRIQWRLPEGAFIVDRATYQRRDGDGAVIDEIAAPLGLGQFFLPPLPGGDTLPVEAFEMQVANDDRSVMWASSVRGFGVARQPIEHIHDSGSYVKAAADDAGRIHVASIERGAERLTYTIFDPDAESRTWLLTEPAANVVLDLEWQDGEPHALTYNVRDGTMALVELGDPTAPIVRPLGQICSEPGCISARIFADALYDAGGDLHIAYYHPVQRVLRYGIWQRAGAPVFTTVDAGAYAGRDVHLLEVEGEVGAVYLDRPAAGEARLVHHNLQVGRNAEKTVLAGPFPLPDADRRGMLDLHAQNGSTTLTWREEHPVDGTTLRFATMRNPARLTAQTAGQPVASVYAPQLVRLPDGRFVVVAATEQQGADFLIRFEQNDDFDGFMDDGVVIGRFRSETSDAPHLAVATDAFGRPRIFVDDEPHGLTVFTLDRVLEDAAAEQEFALSPAGVYRGDSLAATVFGNGPYAMAYRDDLYNLYFRSQAVPADVPFAGPAAGGPQVGGGVALAVLDQGGSTPHAYIAYVAGNAASLYLKEMHPFTVNDPPELLEADTTFYGGNFSARSELRLVTDGVNLHTAWIREATHELVYWRRRPGVTTTQRVYARAAVGGTETVGRSVLTMLLDGAPHVLYDTVTAEAGDDRRGRIVDVDLTDIDAPVARAWTVDDDPVTLLDASEGPDGKLYVAYYADARLYFGPFGGTPTLITGRFEQNTDAVRLRRGADGAIHLFYSESSRGLDGTDRHRVMYQRPLDGASPSAVALADVAGRGFIRYGLDVEPIANGEFWVFYQAPNTDPLAGPVDGQVHRIKVRPGRAPDVSHARVDSMAPLGEGPDDADADGVPDDEDSCPGVWNPPQAGAAAAGQPPLCGPCAEDCAARTPAFFDLAWPDRSGTFVLEETTVGMGDDFVSPCARGTAGSADVVFGLTAPHDGRYTVSTAGTRFDTVLSVWDGCDPTASTELDCNDDGRDQTSSLSLDLHAGDTVYLVVDGADPRTAGRFLLNVTLPERR